MRVHVLGFREVRAIDQLTFRQSAQCRFLTLLPIDLAARYVDDWHFAHQTHG